MIVGIDLGTTHSLIGAMDSGFPVLLADPQNRRLTPSAVFFPIDGSAPLVGWEALEARASHPQRVLTSVKRLMGRRASEVSDPPCAIASGPRGTVQIPVGDRTFSPEEISALILKKLKSDAESRLGCAISRAVITVPAYFHDAQRSATLRAGELAGFTVERIVSEPTAAALAYGLDRLGERSRVAVYDLGGGTFDISLLQLNAGVFEVVATHGDTRLGGDDVDAALAAGWQVSPDLARAAKIALSETDAATLDGRLFLREDLDRWARPVVDRTRRLCERALADAHWSASDLDAVVLVGGATRMPLVRSLAAEIFGREPDVSQHPDEAVALGATIQAGIIEGSVHHVTLLDVTPLSLGIETYGGLMNVLIPRNSTIPCKAGEMFTNAVTNQASMAIRVLQGEREMARDNWELGHFEVPFTPAPKGSVRVGVQFEIDANGILNVLVRDVATGTDTLRRIESAVEVSDEAVEKMLADSLEHAFEDMDERILTEALLKADEMLPAVRVALDTLGTSVPETLLAAVLAGMEKVEAARLEKSAAALKSALSDLDTITQPLATLLVEHSLGTSPA